MGLERVDGVLVQLRLDGAEPCEREPRQLEPVLGGSHGLLVPGCDDHGHVEAVEAQALHRRAGERDVAVVRRVERAAEDAYCHSSVSSPISTSCPLRAPAALSTASSSSPCGASPMMRKPRSVR